MPLTSLVTATSRERAQSLPGDELISRAAAELTHGITIECSARDLWPWLIQMGADRAGWYSYDLIDNGGRSSAEEIDRTLQHPPVGSVFPALPGRHDGFILVDTDPPRWLILGWPAPGGDDMIVSWAFVVREVGPQLTRLIVRVRVDDAYRFQGMPHAIGLWLGRLVHFIMERKQLIEIARRAEGRVRTPVEVGELVAS